MNRLTEEGIKALKTGDKKEARRLLCESLKNDPRDELGWLALAATVSKPKQRYECLLKVLKLNPDNKTAKEELDKLSFDFRKKSKKDIVTKKTLYTTFALLIILAGILGFSIKAVASRIEEKKLPITQQTTLDYVTDSLTPLPTKNPINLADGNSPAQASESLIPLEKSGLQTKTFTFEYECQNYFVTIPMYKSIFDFYSSKDKNYYYTGSVSSDWIKNYYSQFNHSDNDDEIILPIINTVKNDIETKNDDNLVIALTRFVQNIDYDCDKSFSYEYLDEHGYNTNFPYETLFSKKGVCGDLSILLTKFLEELGYGVAYLLFEESNHMSVGIRCPVEYANYIQDGTGYCYIETTAPQRIGVIPQSFGVEFFNETPMILEVSEGKSFNLMSYLHGKMKEDVADFGEDILRLSTCEEISIYKDLIRGENVLVDYETRLEETDIKLHHADMDYKYSLDQYNSMGCEGTLPKAKYNKCLNIYNETEKLRQTYNNLVDEKNNLYDEHSDFFEKYDKDYNDFVDLIKYNSKSCAYINSEYFSIHDKTENQGD